MENILIVDDSRLQTAQLESILEDEYDILFDTDDILKFNSYLTGIDILKKYGVKL